MKRISNISNFGTFFKEKRHKQIDYASQKLEDIKQEIDPNLLATVDSEKFDTTLKRLILKWTGDCSIGDCEGRRLVNEFIRDKLTDPITIAIIADDKIKFSENLKSGKYDIPLLLKFIRFACLSGAVSIMSEMLSSDETIMSQCSTDLIAYAVSSGNSELAFSIAHFFRNKGIDDPGKIYLYSFENKLLAQKIEELFSHNVAIDSPTPNQ